MDFKLSITSFDGVFVQETYSTFDLQTFDQIETFNNSFDGKIVQVNLDASSKFLKRKTLSNPKKQLEPTRMIRGLLIPGLRGPTIG